MATPANRVPVRIARGSKANLDTAIAAGDLKEGEICYATDENGIYVVEGGVLTQAGADLASTSIDALTDVDTTTAAPTDGQVLIWNNVDGEWQPGNAISDVVSDTTPQLGGNLDVNGNYIVSASGGNVEVAPDTTGDFVVRGNNTDGAIVLNCTANTHGVKIQSPPHSAAASYTLVLPDDTGTNGQALITDGSGGLSWAAPSADLSATSIDALSDVDTTTAAPTDGQALVWDNTNSKWEPGTVASGSVTSLDDIGDVDTTTVPPTDGQALVWDNTAGQWEPGTVSGGGGAVTSVNTQTGTVSLGIEDMDDFALNQSSNQTAAQWSDVDNNQNFNVDGEWYTTSTTRLIVCDTDDNGTNQVSFLSGLSTMWVSQDGTNFTQLTVSSVADHYTTGTAIDFTTAHGISNSGYVILADQDLGLQDVPLADGDILQYVSADSKFKPTQLGIDDLADVDTTTAAPTDGQALVWDNAASKWEPGTVSGGGARSTPSITTSSLADAASESVTITGTGKAGQLLAIETDQAAWVTLYCSQSARTSDAGRLETADPAAGSGVIAEAITTGAQTVLVTPCINYFNIETSPLDELYLKVVNKSGATNTITVTLTVVATEA